VTAKAKAKSKPEKIMGAAIFKMKYQLLTGKLDMGFRIIFDGVLKDLSLNEEEVDRYIAKHREELSKICLKEK
jgi:hypothetical protein